MTAQHQPSACRCSPNGLHSQPSASLGSAKPPPSMPSRGRFRSERPLGPGVRLRQYAIGALRPLAWMR
eukprot:10429108-Alexandrium_andersonii.AAC.1